MADFPENRMDMDGDDDVLMRVRATLMPLPAANPQAVARVLAAVHGRQSARARSRWSITDAWHGLLESLRLSPVSLVGGGAIVAAALVGVLVVRGTPGDTRVASGVQSTTPSTTPSTSPSGAGNTEPSPAPALVSDGADPEAALPVQFVFDAPNAVSVSVVGDFNDWSPSAAPMQRLPGAGIWTVTLPVRPGRHVYSFVVDGSRWTADPRAPRAPDADFGKPGSVLMVYAR